MRALRHALALACTLIPGAFACAPDEPEPDARSEHVDLYLDDGIEVCGGQMAAYDRFLGRAFETWTSAAPEPGFRVALHVVHDADCADRSECVIDDEAWVSDQSDHYHQLAHLVHAATDGWSAAGLNEGVASALGPRGPRVVFENSLAAIAPDILFEPKPSAEDDTTIGDEIILGALTRFLVESYGIEAFRTYFRSLRGPEHPDPAEFEQNFEIAFGEPLDDVWAVFASEDRCPYDLWYCDEPDPVELPFELGGIDCGATGTLGFASARAAATGGDVQPGRPYRLSTIVHLDVRDPLTLQIDFEYSRGDFSIGRCGECSPVLPVLVPSDEPGGVPTVQAELEPGIYAFIVDQYGEEPVRLVLSRL